MKTLRVTETVSYEFPDVPDDVTDETAEDWFAALDPAERDAGSMRIDDRTVELI